MTTTTRLPPPRSTRIQDLLRIMELPARQGWSEATAAGDPYTYWAGVGLLDPEAAERVGRGEESLAPTPVIERFFRRVDAVWRPAWYRGEPVVDLGSGWGHLTMWLALSGASEVHSVGDPERARFVARLTGAAREDGLLPEDVRIETHGALVAPGARTLSPTVEPGTVALILMNDTLEHIHEDVLPSLLTASMNDLRPGGRLVSRQHNTSAPSTLARARTTWDRVDAARYAPVRARLARAALPELDDEEVRRLTLATRSLYGAALADAVEAFGATGRLPRPGRVAVNPETGEPAEGRTDIGPMLSAMERAGFVASVHPDMSDSRRSAWLQPLARLLPRPFFSLHLFDAVTVFEGVKPSG